MKKYNIIYCDPPWDYGGRKLNASSNGVELNDHYPTMSLEDLKALPIKNIADKNCLLFMWVTHPKLAEAMEVIKAWGFKYSTVAFEWVKMTSKGNHVCFMGAWTCGGGIELCLLAKRGSVPRISKTVRKMVKSAREEHSKKPDEVRDRIVSLVGDLPRIELFARQSAEGWDSTGDQLSDQDIKEFLIGKE